MTDYDQDASSSTARDGWCFGEGDDQPGSQAMLVDSESGFDYRSLWCREATALARMKRMGCQLRNPRSIQATCALGLVTGMPLGCWMTSL